MTTTAASPDLTTTAAPSLLPLVDQMDFTAGLCSAFAVALHRLWPESALTLLISEDPRHLKTHDWPVDEPMVVHAFVTLPDGRVVDAEGARSLVDLAASFGVRRTYRQRVETVTEDALGQELAFSDARVLDALATVRARGWGPDVPEANGELTRRWKATRQEQTVRGPRPLPPVPLPVLATLPGARSTRPR